MLISFKFLRELYIIQMIVTVDSKWLLSHLDDPNIIIIDARGVMPYRFGHVKNAFPLDVERVISLADNGANLVIDAPTAEKLFSGLGIGTDSSKMVVVYGEYTDPSAARIVWTLMYHGHQNVKMLDVGFNEWQKAGLPVTRQIANQKQSNENVQFKSNIHSIIRADADMINARQQNHSNTIIIDSRTPIEHVQARIPGSILDDWEEGLGSSGEMMKSKEELEKGFEEKRIGKDKEIICYCHSGTRASHKYLQFKQAGYDNVKLYDGSIIDWAQRRNPIR
jgi:thiosulfate/3-mercaptopyruvate sulfurtransferase